MLAQSVSDILERLCVLAATAILTYGTVKQVQKHILSSASLQTHKQDPPGYLTWASKWIFGNPPAVHRGLPGPVKTTMGTSDEAEAQIDGGIRVGEDANTQYKGDFINPVAYGVKPIYTEAVTIVQNHGDSTGTIIYNQLSYTQHSEVKGSSDGTTALIWGFLLLMVTLGFRCHRLYAQKR